MRRGTVQPTLSLEVGLHKSTVVVRNITLTRKELLIFEVKLVVNYKVFSLRTEMSPFFGNQPPPFEIYPISSLHTCEMDGNLKTPMMA